MEQRADKGYRGAPMEGIIASWYSKTTAKDAQRHHLLAEELCKRIPTGSRVLEVAPGPGYFCIELARLGDYDITGLDISRSFVAIATQNAIKAGVRVDFRYGNASAMPFEKERFDFIVCQAAFKNFSQPVQAIAEMYRVLRPGGTALIIDMSRNASKESLDREVQKMELGLLNKWFIRQTFVWLLKRAYATQEMEKMVAQTPFKTCRIEEDGIGFRVWMTKS